MTSIQETSPPRLYLLDWVRLIFLSLIFLYDAYAAVWPGEVQWPFGKAFTWDWSYNFFASFSFAGFVVLAAFAFLAGYKKGKVQFFNLLVLLFVGVIAVSFWEGGLKWESLGNEWDIYHYLLINAFCIYLISWKPKLKWILGLVGISLFLLPWKNYAADFNFSIPIQRIFTGICLQDGRGGWHLFPWIGLSWVMYLFGDITARRPFVQIRELVLWVPVLAFCFWNWGAYSHPPLSLGFYCYVFGQSNLNFWIHMLPIMFLFRVSTASFVQKIFINYPVLQWPSHLYMSKKLGLAFLTHIVVCSVFAEFEAFFQTSSLRLEIYFIVILPLIEGFTRLLDMLMVRIRAKMA
tara:strand:+ start:148393 stop:149439 length:1047 start_codon:yes stop_codon:yes gene_type:complete